VLQDVGRIFTSGHDGTVRVWNMPNKTHAFLQQTCIFYRGEDLLTEDLDGCHLSNLCWNSSGRLLAASLDFMVNIWAIGGQYTYYRLKTSRVVGGQFTSCQLKTVWIVMWSTSGPLEVSLRLAS
jgi:WD40 repeat protein